MSIKKTVIMTVFISAIFIGASFMVAQAYEPLVRIPGLPATGDINLSQYVVGLYNFLLSIVGIVAVMMLIIGGMKYITAAGNASIISDAKDTIWNAIFGLLLALLSWVIVSTINPDVLYIKHPASSLTDGYTADLGNCGVFDPLALPAVNCACNDGITITGATDQDDCNIICKNPPSRCNLSDPLPCIKGGSSNDQREDDLGIRWCHCVENVHVISLAPVGTKCNEICQTPGMVGDGDYHCLVADLKIGPSAMFLDPFPPINPSFEEASRKSASLYDANITSPFIISELSDCQIVMELEYTSAILDVATTTFAWDMFPPYDGVFDSMGNYYWMVDCQTNLSGMWGAVNAAPGDCTLKNSEPSKNAWICPVSIRLTDAAGNQKDDVIYWGFEQP
jgi:hypothetical protein